ncbi:hypothetical protein ACHAXN_009266 [Cyclotella atomus]
MFIMRRPTALLPALLALLPLCISSFTPNPRRNPIATKLHLSSQSIPAAQSRDKQAIAGIKSALSLPKPTLIECEFPPLLELNKLGDGSLRSSLQAEDANVAFVSKLVREIGIPLIGPKVNVLVSSSASGSFLGKIKSKVKSGVRSLKDEGAVKDLGKNDVCVVLTPSSTKDYRIAKELAEGGFKTVIVNGLFKDPKSIPPFATMAYYLKTLTYNSQVSGYLIRQYPNPWTVVDTTNKVLGKFTDKEILVDKTNTPDLRNSVRLAQKNADEKAIRDRAR